MDGLIALMSSTWDSMVAEHVIHPPLSTTSLNISKPTKVETHRGGKYWARKGNSRSSRKNRIDACIRIYGDKYEVEDRKEKECPYGSGDLPYKGRSGK